MRSLPLLLLALLPASAPAKVVLPARGWNAWLAFDVHLNESNVLSNAHGLVSTGLAAAGYTLVALDGGWQGGRHPNGTVYENSTAFPSGLLALSRSCQALGLSFGAYTDRGPETCDGHVGSGGHETQDADFYASIEASYVKEDSCDSTQSHSGALAQFTLMQDALAATGRAFTFSLCGWLSWYAGEASLAGIGNSWRVGPDALNWPNVLMNMDAAAGAAPFVAPGKFVDVDEVMGPSRGRPINPTRTLTQLAFIATVGSPLLLSFDLTGLAPTDADVAPFLNPELLAVHWDESPGGPSFARVAGGALAPDRIPALTRTPCDSPAALWAWAPAPPPAAPATGTLAAAGAPGMCLMAGAAWSGECNNAQAVWLGACGNASGGGPNCCATPSLPGQACTNQHWTVNASSSTLASAYWPGNNNAAGPYLTLGPTTPGGLFLEERQSTPRQSWAWEPASGSSSSTGTLRDSEGTCVGAAPRDTTNVWARRLLGGDVALLFINNGAAAAGVACSAQCCQQAGLALGVSLGVRDLLARTDNGTAVCSSSSPLLYSVPGGGAAVFVRLHHQ